MRTGWNEENKNAPTIAKIAEDFGIQMLAIHGRTRAQKYNGNAEYDTIKEIVEIVSVPVIANGDITTIEKAKKFNIQKILKLKKYSPGKSLNLGIKHSNGKYLVFISAHCLPTNDRWLHHLIKTIKQNNKFAGVYGRQEPFSYSSDIDKRDLLTVFGLDKKVQIKDSFFHN